MLSWFERLIDPYKDVPIVQPPDKLGAFYRHYLRPIWWVYALIMLFGMLGSLIEVSLYAFVGHIVDLAKAAANPAEFFELHGRTLLWMAFVAMVARPVAFGMHTMLINQTANANVMNMVRWQQHRYILRQSLSFFQNDFAGRIANKIMQTGGAVRQSVVETVDALWYVAIYWTSAAVIFFQLDARLLVPLLGWLAGFLAMVWFFVPKLVERATALSEARSLLIGRIVDSYTNILTVKLFAHAEGEDAYAKEAISDHLHKFRHQLRLITGLELTQWILTGMLITGTTGLSLWLWSHGTISLGAIAVTTGLAIRINTMAGWIMFVDHLDFRECRHGAGRHGGALQALDRGRCARRQGIARDEGRDPLRERPLPLRAGQRAARRPVADHQAGREGRPGRAIGRGQVHARQYPAALSRPRVRAHPGRWAGHRSRHARTACGRRSGL